MLRFLKPRVLLILIGFLLLAVFIGYAGPYFAFADYRPLESVSARIICFAVIVALWAACWLFKRFYAFRTSDRLVSAVVQQASPDMAPTAEALQLRERFEEAIATLKQSRRSGHSLYELPWYVIIGAPGSGKTTALLKSGLKFPLEQRVGKGALRGVGGTRNCDWWFTDEAIFLDTAGRYTTQDSDAASDSAGWAAFLALLRKYRKRRPLNGVILTISAQDLMTQGEISRETHVEVARRRLNEINRELHIQLPVYVMVTKCDLVAGFSEYFDDLTQEGRAQVWGVTFPYELTLSGRAMETFPAEFDQLMARLNARLFARIEEDRDARRRTRMFAFPQQMAGLRDVLAQFVGGVFGSTRLDRQTLLRGVYLTSGTQEGTPIDRLLGAIGRRYGVAPDAVAPPTGRGKAYFVERMLKDVLIGECGLAGVNRRLEVQKAALQLGSYAAMAFLAAGGVLALSISYGRNRGYIADVAQELTKFEAVPTVVAAASPEALLPRLDALRSVVDVANRYRDGAPLSMRWGLYQGNSVGEAARVAYLRELDSTLLPRVAARIEHRLVEFAAEPEKVYEYLKAYLMLGDPKHLSKDHVQFVANLEWNASDNTRPEATTSLSRHFRSLLDEAGTFRPIGTNPALIAQARRTVKQASIPRIVYSRLKREFRDDSARDVRLDLAAGLAAESVIRRKSGKSLSEPVSSFFSRSVFQEVAGQKIPALVKQFTADDWVWGDAGAFTRSSSRLSADVTDLYERDYIATWDAILNDIELAPFSNTSQAADALGLLAGPASPVRGILGAISDNTSLLPQTAPASPAASAAAAATKAVTDRLGGPGTTDKLGGLFGQNKDGETVRSPGVLVAAHFQPIHRLMAGEPGKAPIDAILLRIGQVQHQLRTMGPREGDLGSLSDPQLKEILQSLQQEVETAPPVMQALIAQIGRKAEGTVVSGATSELERRYRQDVQRECLRLLSGRYPFKRDSTIDLTLEDFARVFGYGRLFDKFFQENLEPLVDRSKSPWIWRSGGALGSRALLDQFERAQEIRELFFRQGTGALEVRFQLAVLEAEASLIRFELEVDGQVFPYSVPVRTATGIWPGPKPGTAAVTWYERYGEHPRMSFLSQWAWFHLLDVAQEQRVSDVRSILTFDHAAHKSRIQLDATTANNPFSNREWQQFTCQF